MNPFDYIKKEEVIKLTQELVKRASDWNEATYEKKVLDYLCMFLDENNIPYEKQEINEDRYNIIVNYKGSQPGKTLMLNGHIDTVPAYEMDFPSHKGFIEDGWIHGRGANDMKGSVACMIMTVIALYRRNKSFSGNLIVTVVCGEEDDSIGAKQLVKKEITVDAAIVGEPSKFDYAIAHRGLEWLEIEIYGKTAHSGVANKGVNAISKAAKLVMELEREILPLLKKRVHPYSGESILNFGTITGGDQPSTVAGSCTIQLDRRYIAGETPETVRNEIQDVITKLQVTDPEFKATLKVVSQEEHDPYHNVPLETSIDDPLISYVKESVEEVRKRKPQISTKRGWTDAGILSYYGNIPTVVCGPGDIHYSHAKNEKIPLQDLIDGVRIYSLIAWRFCGQ